MTMNIHGLQKLSLLDYPGKLCCTIFTGGCNMRCPFCHNANLVINSNGSGEIIKWPQVRQFLQNRSQLLDAVCITGGEPTIQKGLANCISEIKELGFLVKLDTNGTNPQVLKELVSAELVDYIALDVKNSQAKYAMTVGIDNFDLSPVKESIDFLLSAKIDYEFRTTVVKEYHKQEDLIDIAKWLIGAKQYYLQQFVDSGDLIGSGLHAYSPEEMKKLKTALIPLIPSIELRGVK